MSQFIKISNTQKKPKKTSRKPSRKKSRKPSRKTSRKPKKTSRKPKKTSRKPKKTSRKPKKTSRKPKKTSRKPKKTSRKPKKTSRKPKKTSRKPSLKKSRKPSRKKSRKPSRKKSRKPKKASRKPSHKKSRNPKISLIYLAVPDVVKKKVKITADEIPTYPNKKIDLSKDWDITTIKKDSLFFRGEPSTRKNTLLENMKSGQINPTWYTDVLSNSVTYLPSGAGKTDGGTLYAYALTKDLKLFNLNNAGNFNKLYSMFYDKENNTYDCGYYWMRQNKTGTNTVSKQAKIRTGRHMTTILSKICIFGISIDTTRGVNPNSCHYNNKKCQRIRAGTVTMNDLNRGSIIDGDYIFADWLCHNGFDGWIQPEDMKSHIPPEIMICNPKDSMKLITSIHYPKGVGSKLGDTGKKNIYKGVITAVKVLRSNGVDDNRYYQYYDIKKQKKIRKMKNPSNANL